MIILPAIDILDQQPVRLYQGDYEQKECVGDSIGDIAKAFEQQGARYVHMVDLNGAKEGKKINQDIIVKTAQSLQIPVEVGGGIRSMEDVRFYLEHGIARVILGTAAIENPEFLREALAQYKEKIAVGIDCKNGMVCGHGWLPGKELPDIDQCDGWLQESELQYIDFAIQMEAMGVKTIIVTDISRDGTMTGPNTKMLAELKKTVSIDIIASGGIRDITHIEALKQLDIYGAITGKAMYAETLSLSQAIALCGED